MQKESEELMPEWYNVRKISPAITIFKIEESKEPRSSDSLQKLETKKQTAYRYCYRVSTREDSSDKVYNQLKFFLQEPEMFTARVFKVRTISYYLAQQLQGEVLCKQTV